MRPFAMVAFAFATALLGASSALAQPAHEIVLWGDVSAKPLANADGYNPTSADISIDNVLFFRIRTPAAGYTVAEREAIILRRLTELYSTGTLGPVTIGQVRGRPTIYVGNWRLVTIYPEDATAAGMDEYALAREWAARTIRGLALTAPSRALSGPPSYPIVLGTRILFRIYDNAGFRTLAARGQAVDAKIASILPGFDPAAVGMAPAEGGVAVTYAGKPVVIATPRDAKAARAPSAQALAETWAAQLRALNAWGASSPRVGVGR